MGDHDRIREVNDQLTGVQDRFPGNDLQLDLAAIYCHLLLFTAIYTPISDKAHCYICR